MPPCLPTALLVSLALASVPEGACLDVGRVMGGGERDLAVADGSVIWDCLWTPMFSIVLSRSVSAPMLYVSLAKRHAS